MSKRLAACLALALWACAPEEPPKVASPDPPETTSYSHHAEPEPPRPAPIPPFAHEGDTEYQNGLTSMLNLSPVLGARFVTAVFRMGYTVGLDEGNAFQRFVDGEAAAIGCLEGFNDIIGYISPEGPPDKETLFDTCKNRQPKASAQGALFSKYRLHEASDAAEQSNDPVEIQARVTIYTVGYNMGFAHVWESTDQEAHIEKVVNDRCVGVIGVVKPPFSPDKVAAVQGKCAAAARSIRAQQGPGLKCLLAGKGMNSDLSGTEHKFGCPSHAE